MNIRNLRTLRAGTRVTSGSVLIIVLWVAFGLVTLALYFAHSMSLELRAADNRTASLAAEEAILGAVRYLTNVLGRVAEPGQIPDPANYRAEAVPVGDALFWLIGRGDADAVSDRPTFGLVDEASKLNLNVATLEMLEVLPRMTPQLAAALIDWRDANEDVTEGGAESDTYLRRNPPYRCKNTNYESVAEIRLVHGATLDLLFGDDANLNGTLEPNENDGDVSLPADNRDGRLDPGLLEYLTVHSRQSALATNVNNPQQLAALLQTHFSADRANEILARVGAGVGSVFEFYVVSGITRDEFTQIEGYLVGTNTVGLINVNTASEAVLACVPGLGPEYASALVAHRRTNPGQLNSMAWLTDALGWTTNDLARVRLAGPWLTGRSFQFSADIAAVGQHGRGYRRARFIVDTSSGGPVIRYRQDLTSLGWALGSRVRDSLLLARDLR
ncbi:MAG TPA: helix-hairpin-helix domain-containing protein [Methylomirabilota bacterium]|nr:helix-hairpin-helix domain-containing protein [Methylomirabilota bacterium]